MKNKNSDRSGITGHSLQHMLAPLRRAHRGKRARHRIADRLQRAAHRSLPVLKPR